MAAFTLQGVTIPRGRDRLLRAVRLRGTGMAIRRDVVLGHRFHAPASEDLFFTDRPAARRRPVPSRRRRPPACRPAHPTGGRSAARRCATRRGAWPARAPTCPGCCAAPCGRRDLACLEAAWFLATPPLGVAVAVAGRPASPWRRSPGPRRSRRVRRRAGRLALTVVTGLVQARVPACARGPRSPPPPWYVVWKAVVQVQALVRVVRRDRSFEATAGRDARRAGQRPDGDRRRHGAAPSVRTDAAAPLVALAPADPLDPATFSGLSHRLFAEIARHGSRHHAARHPRPALARRSDGARCGHVPCWAGGRPTAGRRSSTPTGCGRGAGSTGSAPARRGASPPLDPSVPVLQVGTQVDPSVGPPRPAGPLHHRLHGDPGPGRRRVLGEPGVARTVQRQAVECQRQVFRACRTVLTLSEWARAQRDRRLRRSTPDRVVAVGAGANLTDPLPRRPDLEPAHRAARRPGLGAEGRPAAARRLPPRAAPASRTPASSSWGASRPARRRARRRGRRHARPARGPADDRRLRSCTPRRTVPRPAVPLRRLPERACSRRGPAACPW